MTMVWAFLVAAVLVAPFGFVTFRRIAAERSAQLAPDDTPDDDTPDGTAQTGGGTSGADAPDARPVDDVARVLAAIRVDALAHGSGDRFEVAVPTGATIGGRPADPSLVARLLVDDLRRSGVDVEDPLPGTALRCRMP